MTTETKETPMAKGRWWLTTDSRETTIAASPERLYEMVSDMPRMGEWSPETQLVEWLDGATGPAEGVKFIGHNRGGPLGLVKWSRRGRVLAADRGKDFTFITEEGSRESTEWSYRFEPVDGGTRVTESYVVHWIPAWARILDGPLNRHRELQQNMQQTLEQLKIAAEKATTTKGR